MEKLTFMKHHTKYFFGQGLKISASYTFYIYWPKAVSSLFLQCYSKCCHIITLNIVSVSANWWQRLYKNDVILVN